MDNIDFTALPDAEAARLMAERDGWIIVDEYEKIITPEEMLRIITMRGGEYGYCREGVTLQRHRIDGKHCLGHGPGTYDYIAGEFS